MCIITLHRTKSMEFEFECLQEKDFFRLDVQISNESHARSQAIS